MSIPPPQGQAVPNVGIRPRFSAPIWGNFSPRADALQVSLSPFPILLPSVPYRCFPKGGHSQAGVPQVNLHMCFLERPTQDNPWTETHHTTPRICVHRSNSEILETTKLFNRKVDKLDMFIKCKKKNERTGRNTRGKTYIIWKWTDLSRVYCIPQISKSHTAPMKLRVFPFL